MVKCNQLTHLSFRG